MKAKRTSYLLPLADTMTTPEEITIAERTMAMNKAKAYIREHQILLILPTIGFGEAAEKIRTWAAK